MRLNNNLLNINVKEGWNLISGLHSMISYIEDTGNILIPDTLYEFNERYIQVNEIYPGKGYWVKSSKDGIIRIIPNSVFAENSYTNTCQSINYDSANQIYHINNLLPVNSNNLIDHIGKKANVKYEILDYIPIKIFSFDICSVLNVEEFNGNKEKWLKSGIINYSFNFNWSCYCPDEYTQNVKIVVRNNLIDEVIPSIEDTDIDEGQYKTFIELFNSIESKSDAFQISISYDERLGYIKSSYVDESQMIADEEIGFNVSNFKILKEGFLVIEDGRYNFIETETLFEVTSSTKDLPPSLITLSYNSCNISYKIDNSSNVGYYFDGNIYVPELEYPQLLRYGEFFTQDIVECRISITTNFDLFIDITKETIPISEINPKNYVIGNITKYAITLSDEVELKDITLKINEIIINDVNVWPSYKGTLIYGNVDLTNGDFEIGKKSVIVETPNKKYFGTITFTDYNDSNLFQFKYDNVDREYFLYIPDSYNGTSEYPLIFNFHGFNGQASEYIESTNFIEMSEEKKFILVAPQGLPLDNEKDTHWNAALPGGDNKSTVDDFGFILALVDELTSNYRIDSSRIYACGYSNGAFFSYALGLYHSDTFAAIGSISGTMINDLSEENRIIAPLPMINIHGINDYTVPYSGSTEYNSIRDVVNFFRGINETKTEIIDDNDTFIHTVFGDGINGSSVEHYKMKNGDHELYPELNNKLCDFLLKHNLNGLFYDFIVVGGGPSGIMSSYRIAKENPDKRILLIEKNEFTLEEYKTVFPLETNQDPNLVEIPIQMDYKNAFNWRISQEDPRFQYGFSSDDKKLIWLGKGLGGGTLHFGLQYIDNEAVINNFDQDWKSDFEAVAEITGAQRYEDLDNESYTNLINEIKSESDISYFNNKVYSDDLESKNRLLLGNLLSDLSNFEIKYGIKIIKYNGSNVEDNDGNKYIGNNFIMCAGAIQTPAILLRSGIDCGDKLYDHSGFHLVYGKLEPKSVTTIKPYEGEKIFNLNQENIKLLNEKTDRIIRIALGTKSNDNNNVYDFTEWRDNHGGGKDNITRHNNDYILRMPSGHSASRWTGRSKNFRTLIGSYNNDINYEDLPENLKSEDLEKTLFPDTEIESVNYVPIDLGFDTNNILSHIQTRDEEMTWQTYYSTIPGQDNILVLTHALASNLSGAGSIILDPEDNNSNPLVTLRHFGDEPEKYINYLKDAFNKNHKILSSLQYTIIDPPNFNESKITTNITDSIYHYHGSCQIGDVVDENQKVKGTNNLYIGDISVLNKPWAGSTSVPALVTGYRVAKNFI